MPFDDEAQSIAGYLARSLRGRPFILIYGGQPGTDEPDRVVTSDMTEADMLTALQSAVASLQSGGMSDREKFRARLRPDA